MEDFTKHINSIHPAIQFTRKDKQDFNIVMLDAKIRGNIGSRFESIEGTAFSKDCRHSELFMACRATVTITIIKHGITSAEIKVKYLEFHQILHFL